MKPYSQNDIWRIWIQTGRKLPSKMNKALVKEKLFFCWSRSDLCQSHRHDGKNLLIHLRTIPRFRCCFWVLLKTWSRKTACTSSTLETWGIFSSKCGFFKMKFSLIFCAFNSTPWRVYETVEGLVTTQYAPLFQAAGRMFWFSFTFNLLPFEVNKELKKAQSEFGFVNDLFLSADRPTFRCFE